MPPRRSPAASLGAALEESRVLVTCGSGGVGKTTAAAALALRAALSGRRVLVCTIDPSRRLATSLGKGQLTGRPRAISHIPSPISGTTIASNAPSFRRFSTGRGLDESTFIATISRG
jgi:Mrp family chromosome partitioning ATPase